MTTHPLLCFLILSNPLGLFSIHFDAYYKFYGSPQSEYPQNQSKSKCQFVEECCRASCVLPTRTATTACLVPDNKEAFHFVDNSNVTLVNCLLNSSSQNSNNTHHERTFETQLTSRKKGSYECVNEVAKVTKGEDKVTCHQTKGGSLLEVECSNGLKQLDTKLIVSENVLHTSVEDVVGNKLINPRIEEIQEGIVRSYQSDLPQELKLRLQNCYSFLLLNSTIESASLKNNLSQIYEALRNSDVSKVLVKLLQEKLKFLKEKEALHLQSSIPSMVSEVTLSPAIPRTSTEASKWDLVRQAFLKNPRSKISTPKLMEVSNQLKSKDSFVEHNEGKQFIGQKASRIDSIEAFKEMMDTFYAGRNLDFASMKENGELHTDIDKAADYDSIEYFNMNLPYNIEQVDPEVNPLKNFSTTERSTEIVVKAENMFKGDDFELKISQSQLNNQLKLSVQPTKKYANRTQDKSGKKVLWSTNKNKSWELSNKFKNVFVWSKKTKNSKEKKPFKLNEQFLLTLNSRNLSKEVQEEFLGSSEVKKDTKPSSADDSPSYSSSIESSSSESEDLYNNSIVFVVHERNSTGLEKDSRWRSILNFFHIAKSIPCPHGKNPCIDASDRSCSSNKLKSDENVESNLQNVADIGTTEILETTTQKVIYLPESLMPEVLEDRLLNDSGLTFYDDLDKSENSKAEDHNSTSSSFFFFFK